jgi:predicted deacylase
MRSIVVLAVAAAVTLAGCGRPQHAGQPFPTVTAAGELQVRLAYHGPVELGRAVDAGLDLFGVDADKGMAFGQVDQAGLAALQRAGLRPEPVPADKRMGIRNTFDKGYRTYEQVTTQLHTLADAHPQLMAVKSIGKAWENEREIWTTRLTGPGDASKRPAVSFTANLHARELVTVEVAMNLIQTLVEGYDKDPAIKKLLDTRVVYVAPMLNPDGHHQAEKGADWRKNTHKYPGGTGVDLNRNFPFKWGLIGTSSAASSDIFRGPSAASEPETQAVRDYLSSIPNLKIGMDYHSYSNLVMWPWGWTDNPPPDAPMLSAIGKKLAGFNHYKPEQASDLYATSGTIRDFVYGQLHVPYFTTEMGGENDGFDPPYARAQQIWEENKPGALWLISIADDPAQVTRRLDK